MRESPHERRRVCRCFFGDRETTVSAAFEAAKRAVRERTIEPCEYCAPFVEQLVKDEAENRSDPYLNRVRRFHGAEGIEKQQ